MERLDKIDTKILKELLVNGRLHVSDIGKKVRLGRENVHYRIQKLIKQGIIRDFITSIDYKKLQFSQYTVFLEFEKITTQEENDIIDYLKKKENISWVGRLAGKWSLTFDIYVKNDEEFNKIIIEFLTKFKENIGDYIVLNVLDAAYYFDKIINETNYQHQSSEEKEVKIDKTDRVILKRLNENARVNYVEISQVLRLTPNAIKQRVKNLEKSGIIKGYSVSLNHKLIGFEWHGLQIKIKKHSLEQEKNLRNYFKTNKKIIFYYQYSKTGEYDFDIGVLIKDSSELREFINQLRNKFSNEVKIYDMFVVLEEVSSQKLPEVIFK